MPQAAFDVVVSDPKFSTLPLSTDQAASGAPGGIKALVLLLALVTLLLPALVLTAFAVPVLAMATQNPTAAVQALIGIGMSLLLLAVPARRLIHRFGRGRRITIDRGIITVSERSALRSRVWSTPLAEYRGLAHHVRANLSGLRHELILVHSDRARSVLLHTADHISETTLAQAAALLHLPRVPAAELYRFRARGLNDASPVLAPANSQAA
jgi:hypothetical protein